MSFIVALDQEISVLRAQLSADPRYIRLRELERIRHDLYPDEPAAPPSSSPRDSSTIRSPGRRRSAERQKAIDAVTELLTGKAEPIKTVDIDRHLRTLGIRLGGSNPLNNLSALLYHAPGFRSNGRAGWTLNGARDQ
jgi:hypothetical protein